MNLVKSKNKMHSLDCCTETLPTFVLFPYLTFLTYPCY